MMDLNYRQKCVEHFVQYKYCLLTYLFTYNTQTQWDVLCQDFARNILDIILENVG
jgi:hypothetical protein